jgi:hypothetical protein
MTPAFLTGSIAIPDIANEAPDGYCDIIKFGEQNARRSMQGRKLIAMNAKFFLIAFFCLAGQSFGFEPTRSVIVVRPKAWSASIQEWANYRKSEYEIIEVDSIESPYDLRQKVLNAVRTAKHPTTAVLLCGDVANAKKTQLGNLVLEPITPTFEIPTRVKLGPYVTPTLATDSFYGDLDDDECPDLSVGRLPAKDPKDLARMLRRSLDYEQSSSMGPWRDRIHATAGVGGFGMVADTAIETVTRRLFSEGIPDRFQLQMTFASLSSPYCPPPQELSQTMIRELNEGGLFWVYIGHGNVNCLDDMIVGDSEFPICTSEHVPQIQIPHGQPIAVMLACFTGAFDAKVDCFAEMLLAKSDGPIAVIAGSRVTMPYGMSQIATEMMDGCFVDKIETIGEILLKANRNVWNQGAQVKSSEGSESESGSIEKRLRDRQKGLMEGMALALSPEGHSLVEERREHVRLMNLLGDPLLRIRQPKEITLRGGDQFSAGQVVTVAGDSPLAGTLSVELALTRDRLPTGIKSIERYENSESVRDAMRTNYDTASDLVLWRTEKKIPSGSFSVDLPLPSDIRGKYVIRVFVYGDQDWATGSQRIKILKSKAP